MPVDRLLPADPRKPYWTMADVAEFWGVKVQTVRSYRARGRGELPEEDDVLGQTPVWRPHRIIGFFRPGRGARTDLHDTEGTTMDTTPGSVRVSVYVMLTIGDQAELVTPDHTAQEPLRVRAADIARDAGLPANELPGRRFTAVRDGDAFRHFQLIDDPRR